MDKDLIMDQLRKIVQARGGKYKPKHELADVSEKYKNQYEDDGSIEFEKIRAEVVKKTASYIFDINESDVGIKEMAAVPEDTIKKVLSKLKQAREIEIDDLIRADKMTMKALDVLEQDKNKVDYLRNLTKAKKQKLGEQYTNLKYPELDMYKKQFKSNQTLPPKISSKAVEDIASMFYPSEKNDIITMFGKGLIGGTKKRGPSKYNLFVKDYLKKHKGHSMSDASRAWKKK